MVWGRRLRDRSCAAQWAEVRVAGFPADFPRDEGGRREEAEIMDSFYPVGSGRTDSSWTPTTRSRHRDVSARDHRGADARDARPRRPARFLRRCSRDGGTDPRCAVRDRPARRACLHAPRPDCPGRGRAIPVDDHYGARRPRRARSVRRGEIEPMSASAALAFCGSGSGQRGPQLHARLRPVPRPASKPRRRPSILCADRDEDRYAFPRV